MRFAYLALLGADLCGHVVAYRSGHPLNVELVRTLDRQRTARFADAFPQGAEVP